MAKRKNRKWLILILILMLIGIVGFAFYKNTQKPKGTEVQTDIVKKRTILETVSASGRIFPETEVKISSDVSGEIVELYIQEGDSVKANQILAKIDPESYVSAVQRGQAAVAGAKSRMAVSKSQKESSIAQKEQIMVQLKNAQVIHDRNNSLLKDGVISQSEYDQSGTNVENLNANIKAAEASIRSAEESIKGAQYDVESSEATLKELQTNLGRTTIKAPVSGIVSSLSVEQGERVVGTIQMTGTEMMRIANLRSMEVQVDVSENDIVRVTTGQNVDIEIDAYLGESFKGTVTEIANSASNIAGAAMALNTDQVTNFVVKIKINPESYSQVKNGQKFPFRPGMSASVDIHTKEIKDVISVPIQAVTAREKDSDKDKDDDGDQDKENEKEKEDSDYEEVVFTVGGDTVAMKRVETGIQDDEFIQIISGLDNEETIVKGPYMAISEKLKDGSEIYEEDEDGDKKERKK